MAIIIELFFVMAAKGKVKNLAEFIGNHMKKTSAIVIHKRNSRVDAIGGVGLLFLCWNLFLLHFYKCSPVPGWHPQVVGELYIATL